MKFAVKAIFSLFVLGCADAQAASLIVRAVATDSQAVVLSDSSGELRHYAKGTLLAGERWRFAGVVAGKAVFAYEAGSRGGPLEVSAGRGDSVDLDAIATRYSTPPAPVPRPIAQPVAAPARGRR